MNAVANDVSPSNDETVTMSDGRQVVFAGKRKLLKETIVDGSQVSVRLDFRNGKSIVYEIPDSLILRFAGHGAEQKLGDATAGEQNVDDMVEAVESVILQLNKGEWNARREGGAGGFAGASVLLRALVEVSGKPIERVREYLGTLNQKEKLALRQSPKLKPTIERIEAENASKSAATVDTDALLNAL